MNAVIDATTLRTALIARRNELISRQSTYPVFFDNDEIDATVKSIDEALYAIEGNITQVMISPVTCKLNA
jgi:hypothetical protein